MMDRLTSMAVFVKAAEAGSFAAASHALRLSGRAALHRPEPVPGAVRSARFFSPHYRFSPISATIRKGSRAPCRA